MDLCTYGVNRFQILRECGVRKMKLMGQPPHAQHDKPRPGSDRIGFDRPMFWSEQNKADRTAGTDLRIGVVQAQFNEHHNTLAEAALTSCNAWAWPANFIHAGEVPGALKCYGLTKHGRATSIPLVRLHHPGRNLPLRTGGQ